jgi:hypothetical protein
MKFERLFEKKSNLLRMTSKSTLWESDCPKGIKKSGGKRIMISSHMDEIGLMASHINDKGFVYVATIGGVNPLTCFGARVKFLNGTEGVVYAETKKMDKVRPLISCLSMSAPIQPKLAR